MLCDDVRGSGLKYFLLEDPMLFDLFAIIGYTTSASSSLNLI
jgi:hypothetical protein